MTHTFIVNTENVNEYGYRILTAGIDTKQYERNPVVLFMHDRYNDKARGSEVIGKVVKLWKDKDQLMVDIEFDTEDEFAKKIAGKVERGIIRMASMYADIIGTSSAVEDLLPGQAYETITECKLIEISIVDIGGNDDALKLSKGAENLKLKKLSINQNENMSHLKVIALAYGLNPDADETAILAKHNELKTAKETAEASVVSLKLQLKDIQKAEATSIVEECIKLGLLPEALKANQLESFEANFDTQKAVLSKLVADKKAENGADATHEAVRTVILGGADKGAAAQGETFDFLQKFDVVKLQKMQSEDPTTYAKLYQDYQNGVRHVAKV